MMYVDQDATEDSVVEDISQSELMSAIISAAEAAEKFDGAAPKVWSKLWV